MFSHVRSWADDIPLGSLDQLQQATGSSHSSHGDVDDPASIPLPVSRESLLRDSGSEDLQHAPEQLHQADTAEAVDVPLPESSGLGNDSFSSRAASVVDSLAQLETAHIPVAVEQSPLRPIRQDYWENIKPLAQVLPHLQAIQPHNGGRHQYVGRLKSIDYFNNGTAPRAGIYFKVGPRFDHDQLVAELQNMKRTHDDTVAFRTIVVEDLCSEVIAALGSVFELDPELFAEHLNRSGYNHADYEDPTPTRWNTAHLQKDHASMTWMRPVYQSVKVAELLQDPISILDTSKESPETTSTATKSSLVWRDAEFNIKGERDTQAMEHTPQVDTNIFRQSRLLSARSIPRADLRGVEDEVPQTGPHLQNNQNKNEFLPAAWEERVSFCYPEEYTGTPIGMWHPN